MRMLANLLFSLSLDKKSLCFLMVSLERTQGCYLSIHLFFCELCRLAQKFLWMEGWIEITKMLANYLLSLFSQITQKAKLPNHRLLSTDWTAIHRVQW